MYDKAINFQYLLHPVLPEVFFEEICDREVRHIPGPDDKFAPIFSWEELNRLLNMTDIWSGETMKLVLDRRKLAPSEYCHPSIRSNIDRSNVEKASQRMLPDAKRVIECLRRGATLILNHVETMTPGASRAGVCIGMALGAPTNANVYCSWNQHQGFECHFDDHDVLVLQIEGRKTWRIYEGRFEQPAQLTGYFFNSIRPERHARAKGAVREEVEMSPGDVLYLPKGQYHDALASSEASLHLTFGIGQARGFHFMDALLKTLPEEPLFRAALPHFDDREAHEAHVRKLADRFHDIMVRPDSSSQMRRNQKEHAYFNCQPAFALPARDPSQLYRVRSRGVSLRLENGDWRLTTTLNKTILTADAAEVAQWVLQHDYFAEHDLGQSFSALEPAALGGVVNQLERVGLLEPL